MSFSDSRSTFVRATSIFLLIFGLLATLFWFVQHTASAQSRVPTGLACVRVQFNHSMAISETLQISVQADPADPTAGAAGSIAEDAVGTTKHFTETGLAATTGTSGGIGAYCTETVVYEATYTMTVKSTDTLTLLDSSVTTNFLGPIFGPLIDGTLPEGDVDNNNYVNILDLGLIVPSYEKPVGDGAYNVNADLNEDTAVNILDIGLLIPNYEQEGARAVSAPDACGAVTLDLSDNSSLAPGDGGTLIVGWTGGDIDTFALDLTYDTGFLSLDSPSSPATISGFAVQVKNTSSGSTIEVDGFNFGSVTPRANFVSIPYTTNAGNVAGASSAFTVTSATITCGGPAQTVNFIDTGEVTHPDATAITLNNYVASAPNQTALLIALLLLLIPSVSLYRQK